MAFPVVARTEKESHAPDRAPRSLQRRGSLLGTVPIRRRRKGFRRSTLVTALDGGVNDPRAIEFLQQLEAAVARHLSNTPEPMQIPLAALALVKR
jgi:hypothetical protein